MSIYEQIGGEENLETLVELFYRKVLGDNSVNYFFSGVSITRLKKHQREFLKYALGGSNTYTGPQIRKAHQRLVSDLGLSEKHFNIIATHLNLALEDLNIDPILINEILEIVGTTKKEVLNE